MCICKSYTPSSLLNCRPGSLHKSFRICPMPLLFLIEKLWLKAEMKESNCSPFTRKKLMLVMTIIFYLKYKKKLQLSTCTWRGCKFLFICLAAVCVPAFLVLWLLQNVFFFIFQSSRVLAFIKRRHTAQPCINNGTGPSTARWLPAQLHWIKAVAPGVSLALGSGRGGP